MERSLAEGKSSTVAWGTTQAKRLKLKLQCSHADAWLSPPKLLHHLHDSMQD